MNKPFNVDQPEKPTPLARSELRNGRWSTSVKIRFGQCDPAGIV